MKRLLLGGGGQVGRELQRALAGQGELVVATREGTPGPGGATRKADFADPGSLAALVREVAPAVVVNAAAYTAVDLAEREPGIAFRVNAEAPGVLAAACRETGARLVHFSTDYVFDGAASRPYREDDAPAPLGVYGRSKLAGETAVRDSGCEHMIFRLCWVYAAHGHNFLQTMLRLAAERDTLRVVADQVGSPTPAAWIADAVAAALAAPARTGTWHVAASGRTSWHGFAEAIVEAAAAAGMLASSPRVDPFGTADYPTPARRPAWSVLDTSRLHEDFGLRLPDWRDGVGETLAALRRH